VLFLQLLSQQLNKIKTKFWFDPKWTQKQDGAESEAKPADGGGAFD